MNYFHDMTDEELLKFYILWRKTRKNGNKRIKEPTIIKALDYFKNKNQVLALLDCKRDMLYEIAERWQKIQLERV